MTVRRSEVLALALRVLTVVYLVFLVLLIWNFLPFGDDIAFHLQRLDALSQEFRLGVDLSDFPFRVYTTTLDGYGYGSPLFYGDIFLYPFALLSSLGVSVYTAYRLLLIAMLLGSYLSLRLLMREVTSSRKTLGFSLGLFYAVLSTTLYGEVVGSCVGRGLVWIFAPLAIAGFYRVLFTDRPRGWVLLAVGAGGTLLAHPLNIVLLLVVLLLMLAVSFRRVNRRAVTQILLSAAVAILATLWYTLPMLEQMLSESFFVTSAAVDNGKTILSDFTVPLSGIVLPSQLRTTLLSLMGIDAPQRLYKAGLLIALLALVAFALRWRAGQGRGRGSFCASLVLVAALAVWFQTPLFPHDLLQGVLGVLQFPWRIYVFAELSIALLLAIAYDGSAPQLAGEEAALEPAPRPAGVALPTVLSCLVLLLAVVFVGLDLRGQIESGVVDGSPLPLSERLPYSSLDVGSGEYVPANVFSTESPYYDPDRGWFYVDAYLADRGCVATASEPSIELEAWRDGRSTYVSYSGAEAGDTVSVPLLMYQGYAAVNAETGEALPVSEGEDGFVEVGVDDASGTIRVWYAGTTIQHVANAVSLLSLVVVAAVCAARRGHGGSVSNMLMG